MALNEKDARQALAVLALVRTETEADVQYFDGKPLTGKTVAEIHANLAASTIVLANVLEAVVRGGLP